jgi:hypothetical protein
MNDFITKPFDPLGLVRSVRDQARRPRSPVTAVSPLGAAVVPIATGVWPALGGVDFVAVRAMLGDDAGLFRSLLGKLLRDFARVTLPAAGCEPGELESIRPLAQQLTEEFTRLSAGSDGGVMASAA